MKIVLGSRGSKLALVQTEEVKRAIQSIDPTLEVEIKVIHTKGDKILDKPLNRIGDKGLFTKEIEAELLDGTIDIAVHSMKDMPGTLPEGLAFAGTLAPADPRDCLVFNHGYKTLADLPEGATIGTGSPRRVAQLKALRPDLNIVGIRGNVITRLEKMKNENMDGIVLACAGLKRLGMGDLIGYPFSFLEMVPACAQGILALEIKEGSKMLELIEKIQDPQGTERLQLERCYLETIGGSCHMPIGCHITYLDEGIAFDAVYGKEDHLEIVTRHLVFKDHYLENIRQTALEMKAEVESHG